MKNKTCLYHQLTSDKQRQITLSNKSLKSIIHGERRFQKNKKQRQTYHDQEDFNDYTIYPPKQIMKRKQYCLNDISMSQEVNEPRTRLNFFRGEQQKSKHLSQNCSSKNIRTVRTSRSQQHKVNVLRSLEVTPQESFNQNIVKLLSLLYEERIFALEKYFIFQFSKIVDLNKKLQKCENETIKNHYEFILLRDIVQKMKIQNLELSSRISANQNFVKFNKQLKVENEQQQQKKQNQSQFDQESTSSQKFDIFPLTQPNDYKESFSERPKIDFDQPSKKKKNSHKKVLPFANGLRSEKPISRQKYEDEQKIFEFFESSPQKIEEDISLMISSQENLLQSISPRKKQNQSKRQSKLQYESSIVFSNQVTDEKQFFNSTLKLKKNLINLKQKQTPVKSFTNFRNK